MANNTAVIKDVFGPHINLPYQRNKYNFIYRNACAKVVSKKIKEGKNKK